ncbi:MAG: ATP-dependent protease ATPase subunit HslU [Nannocystaceae bacterium]|nr:ATP-dependent protease ATPase subunit HslU [Nannocystaceae bacterium]
MIGQHKAKRAVAIAMRNRWRRQMVDESIRDEISPKNIIMVGPTGVGKTEIARRLARLTGAPFLKVEVSKFTEVGYVGRDVDAIIRDLVEVGAQLVREELRKEVRDKAGERAEERILDLLLPPADLDTARAYTDRPGETAPAKPASGTREKLRDLLRAGKLDAREIEIEVEASAGPGWSVPPGMAGNEQVGQQLKDLFGQLGRRSHKRTVKVADARELLVEEEAAKLVDADTVARRAVQRCEQLGVVFLDEIDKICGRENMRGADISREGVQRDLLPLVEGSTVQTKYGPVKSDHILFVAAGAFHVSKVSDLIPELQGRFPIRVELDSLSGKDFARILREPANSLLKQYAALMATEEVMLSFEDDAIDAMAELAFKANTMLENIGARRLHTVLERVLEDLSFDASELGPRAISISAADVHERVDALLSDQDLSRHIL